MIKRFAGIVIMALRLQRQAKYLPTEDVPIENLILELQKLVNTKLKPHNAKGSCHPGRISPLGSASLGAAVVRIIAAAQRFISPSGNVHHRVHQRDILAIRAAMDVALQQGTDIGGDELLYGRVGLLHALLNIRNLQLDDESKEALEKLAFKDISQLVDHIVNSGKLGARDYLKPHGEQESMPLMWPWHGKYYTGA